MKKEKLNTMRSIKLFIPLLLTPYLIFAQTIGDYPITQVPYHKVNVQGFWGDRLETNASVTLWHNFQLCEETSRQLHAIEKKPQEAWMKLP